ncbi:RagB/SusD family nutrient uptake outer membrane protein [Pedobacter punctiformis]|uniref:RagB/SusD family nutrient uptake outer membrane protein n=1 Tax=Pedobacter punctiformis TaxID=3004097 RepID=A0ABT4LBE9_9SPHI|nr:RagB/SusD family nutrient uptake outer membrane protein [Pedobacter sp. HCMS5-2]MCZ4245042.1 RagB/SusD family nutrient uptake outer membrane protein [Pedobacter sp. HCMS5-2]
MKRLLYIFILTLGILVSNSGCKKFLAEQSQDEIKPSTIQELNSIMAADAYPYSPFCLSPLLNIVTDDVVCNGGQAQLSYQNVVKAGKSPFSWSKNMFEELLLPGGLSNTTHLDSWKTLYQRIASCNVGLAYVNKVSGSEEDKQNLKAQMLALRAYYYFNLVNMFGKPYNAQGVNPANSPGVPLKLNMEVTDEFYTRNSVAEVYQQIEADLLEAANLFRTYPKSNGPYKMNEIAVYTFLSRMYLYEEKWDQAIDFASKGLAKKSALTQLYPFGTVAADPANPYATAAATYNSPLVTYERRIYDTKYSTEVIWAYAPSTISSSGEDGFFKSQMNPAYKSTSNNPPYGISPDLLNLYDSKGSTANYTYIGDLRPRLYFSVTVIVNGIIPGSNPIAPSYAPKYYFGGMGSRTDGTVGGAGFRVAELYMNRAEANIQKFINTGNDALRVAALNDINTLRVSRYDPRQAYVPIDLTDKTALLNFCRDERRREFPFDGHRWFDLRRYGMPSISHVYNETGTPETFTLVQGDNRYTWPIPQEVLDRNGALTQNP